MDRMPTEEQFVCVNIRDFLNKEESVGIGENDLEKILSDFSSPKNSDVESFLKKNAIEFLQRNLFRFMASQDNLTITKIISNKQISLDNQEIDLLIS